MRCLNNILLTLLALIAGTILPLTFAPFNWWPVAFISPALLLFVWLRSKPWQAFWRGFLFGIGLFAVGASWIYISIHIYGKTDTMLAAFITAIFVLIMGVFPATQGLLFSWLFKRNQLIVKCLLAFPAMWVLWEWLRSWVFTGFPWLFLGYSQIDSILRSYAPLLGVYGISLIITFISACLLLLFIDKRVKIKIISVAYIIILFGVAAGISSFQWTTPTGRTFKVSLVQGNITQNIKWDMNYLLHILNVYKYETEQHWNSNIIVWPEAAIPVTPQQVSFFFNLMNDQAKKHHTALILGAFTVNPKTNQFYNSIIVLGNGKGTYLKRQLVPFGEYVPLKKLFSSLMKYINIPMSDLSRGPWKQATLIADSMPIAPFLCYEITYPIEVLNSVHNKQMIVAISDDSWFGNSIALPQQLQIAQMRALETGRYLLYGNNTGITAIIGPQGRLLKTAPTNKQTVLSGTAKAIKGKTPLMCWNYYPVLGLIVIFLVLAFIF